MIIAFRWFKLRHFFLLNFLVYAAFLVTYCMYLGNIFYRLKTQKIVTVCDDGDSHCVTFKFEIPPSPHQVSSPFNSPRVSNFLGLIAISYFLHSIVRDILLKEYKSEDMAICSQITSYQRTTPTDFRMTNSSTLASRSGKLGLLTIH